MNGKNWLMTFFLVVISFSSYANELVLSGSYQGKDIFVQNPYNKTLKKFCTEAVYVNDRKVFENPSLSAFKIDLSYLKTEDLVVIRITYSEGCTPSIVNPQALKETHDFQFLAAQADLNSITWSVKGEKSTGKYFVEHLWKKEKWSVIDTLKSKSEFKVNKYAVSPSHQKGVNKYRIRFQDGDGREYYSMVFDFAATENYITFYPEIATTSLILSDTTDFLVEDYFGKTIKKGTAKTVTVTDLKPGKYYLIIQNRKEQFIKR